MQTFDHVHMFYFCLWFRSASLSDILNEDEVGHLPHISQSRYERMQEQYNSFREEENEWQDVRDMTLHGDSEY